MEREELLQRVRGFEEAAQQRVLTLRTQLERAEEFAATLRGRLHDMRRPGHRHREPNRRVTGPPGTRVNGWTVCG